MPVALIFQYYGSNKQIYNVQQKLDAKSIQKITSFMAINVHMAEKIKDICHDVTGTPNVTPMVSPLHQCRHCITFILHHSNQVKPF